MRLFLPAVALVGLLVGCAQQNGTSATYNSAGSMDMLQQGQATAAYGEAGAVAARQTLTTCIYARNAAQQGAPSLASRLLGKISQSGDRVEIGLDDVLSYTGAIVSASGGDGIAAAEIISRHEASDSACFRDQAAYWRGQGSAKDAASNAQALSKASSSLGRAYSMLKTYTATGDAKDLPERLSRSYIPVGMILPGSVL